MFDEKDFFGSGPTETFGGITFKADPVPSTEDTLIRTLAPADKGFARPIIQRDHKETDAAVKRVNTNSAQNGVFAFKDDKGQAVLTNVARTPEGKDAPIFGGPQTLETQKGGAAAKNMPVSNVVGGMLTSLKAASNQAEAQAAYEGLTGAIAQGMTEIKKNALEFASNKLGIPTLERQLMDAEAADKADPNYYPGIGDSKFTAAIRTQINTARNAADEEAKKFLATNFSYTSLNNIAKMAEIEFQRKVKLQDFKDQRTFNAEQRQAEKDAAKEAKDLELADSIPSEVLSRMQILNPQDFSTLDEAQNPALKGARIIKTMKNNKSYMEAIQEDEAKLPKLAIKGNEHAAAIVIAREASNTNRPADVIKQELKAVRDLANSRDLEKIWAKEAQKDSKKAASVIAEMAAMKDKPEATDRRVDMALEVIKARKTQKFVSDVSSWGSVDSGIQLALANSRKVTASADIENVLTAFVGDSSGKERANKIVQFGTIMKEAAYKQQNSVFGMPEWRAAETVINQWATRGLISRMTKSVGDMDMRAIMPFKELSFGMEALVNYANKPTDAEIDPRTGRKFGE